MRVLVTGGSGFIGNALIKRLLDTTDYQILNLDNLTYASNPSQNELYHNEPKYSFSKIDICNYESLKKAYTNFKPNFVMHLAAETHVDRSINSPNKFINTNIIGTMNLLEISKDFFISLGHKEQRSFRFHLISTDEVYGELLRDELPFTEESKFFPNSPYAASKASSEHLTRAWHRTYNLPTIITNSSNNYGPYQNKEKLIPKTIKNALQSKKIPVYGNGSQVRDWIHVDDHADALIQCISKGIIGESYNIGGMNEIKNIDLIRMICNLVSEIMNVNNKDPQTYEKFIEFVQDRPGHDRRYSVNISKIQKALNWEPKKEFHQGLKETVQWYILNENTTL